MRQPTLASLVSGPVCVTVCVTALVMSSGTGCRPGDGAGAAEPDLDLELAREAEAIERGEAVPGSGQGNPGKNAEGSAEPEAPKGALTRFDLDRGKRRNGAGFRVLARETPDGGRVVAFEFDGTFRIGEDRHESGKYGGVALVSFGADGTLRWSRKLNHKDYHYVAALAVAGDGDILVGGSFGERGMILTRLSKDGAPRWTFQPENEPKWAEVSSFDIDPNGDVVLSGLFQAKLQLPGQKPMKSRYFDGFVAKLTGTSGAIQWLQQLSSVEAKASAMYVAPETGDVFVGGDYRKFLKVGGKELKSKREFFFARFSAAGEVVYLAPVAARFAGNVISIQPMAGERAVLHLRDPRNSELVALSEKDGTIRWVAEDNDEGGALVYDADRRPKAVHYAVHDADPRFGSTRILIREIVREDRVRTVKAIDAGPYMFMSRGTVRRAGDGAILISGSLRDKSWDNDGFYPYLLDLQADARRLNLERIPTTGRGSGSRCQGELPQKQVWRDLRVAVRNQRLALTRCVADPSAVAAEFALQPDGTVTGVTVEGELDADESACLTEALSSVRVCPYTGSAYKRRLGQLL